MFYCNVFYIILNTQQSFDLLKCSISFIFTLSMILYLVIDLDNANWQFLQEPQKTLNNIILLVNIFLKLNYMNQVFVVCNKKIIFNTKQKSLNFILKNLKSVKSQLSQDLGYLLCLANKIKMECRIFVFSLQEIEKHVNLIKCAFVAEKMKIRIDGVAFYGNDKLKETCYATGGLFCEVEQEMQKFIFSIFCDKKIEVPYFTVKCFCHDAEILFGLVCPICLAIYCKFIPICRQCKTKINFLK